MFRLEHRLLLENLKALEMENHPQRQLQQTVELKILGWAFLLTPAKVITKKSFKKKTY
jgi:hypothetical protein